MPHAYIFHGPDGVGKELFARALASVLLCPDAVCVALSASDRAEVGLDSVRAGCGTCDDCKAVGTGTHPDLHLVYRQLSREHPDPEIRRRKALELGVDVVRHFLVGPTRLTAVRGRAKVFIVREADRITAAAQNALLKTLEEPPPRTTIILLVQSLDRILPTTLSRCHIVEFGTLPESFVEQQLSVLLPALSAHAAHWYAAVGAGSIGQAVQDAREGLFDRRSEITDVIRTGPAGQSSISAAQSWIELGASLGQGFQARDPDITETESHRRGLKVVFRIAATWFDDLLRNTNDKTMPLINEDCRQEIESLCRPLDREATINQISRLVLAERQLDLNANVQLVVEAMMADLRRLANSNDRFALAAPR